LVSSVTRISYVASFGFNETSFASAINVPLETAFKKEILALMANASGCIANFNKKQKADCAFYPF